MEMFAESAIAYSKIRSLKVLFSKYLIVLARIRRSPN
jgi:hypothetical protein